RDDRVVAPVLPVAELPEVEAGGEHPPVDAARELLHAREQRAAVDRRRRGLDHPDVGIALHELNEAHERLAGHHAVGVEHDHVPVAPAPAPAEVGDVAALALETHLPAPVEDAVEATDRAAPLEPRLLLLDGRSRIAGVAQHEEVESLDRARTL